MNVMNFKSVSFVLVLIISGCATTSDLTAKQKVELSPYQTKINQACINHHKVNDKYEASTEVICTSRAQRATESMEAYYLLYNEETIISNCKNTDIEKFNKCLHDYQNKHYISSTENLIKKIYPQ